MSATQTTPFGFRCGQKDKKTTRTVRLQNVKLTQKALLSFNVCCVFFFLDVFPCVCAQKNRCATASRLVGICSVSVLKSKLLVATQSEQPAIYDGERGLITSNLTSCLMNTGTSFSGNEFSLENCGSCIQVYLNEVTWGR